MRRLPLVLLAGGALAATSALAAAAPVRVQLPPPPNTPTARSFPPTVLAYPLAPDRDWVFAQAPRGRATLQLTPGAWVVASRFFTPQGRLRTRAQLVTVAGRAVNVRQQAATPASVSVQLGTIRITDPDFAGARDVPAPSEWWSDIRNTVPRGSQPCRPKPTPPKRQAFDPVWNAVLQELQKAAARERGQTRAQARAAAARLRGGPPAQLTVSGEITSVGSTYTGTYRLTDDKGNVVSERQVSGSVVGNGAGAAYFRKVYSELLRDVCAPPEIQVDARIRMRAQSPEVQGEATLTLKALGRTRIGPDGRPEYGNYEYAQPTRWVLESQSGSASPGARCPAVLTGTDLTGGDVGPPTALGTARGRGFSLILIAPGLQGFALQSPCSEGSTESLPVNVAVVTASGPGTGPVAPPLVPGIPPLPGALDPRLPPGTGATPGGVAIDLPGPDQVVNVTRTGAFSTVTGDLTLDVIVKRR